MYEDFSCTCILVNTCYCMSFNVAVPVGENCNLIVVSICISLMPDDIQHLFMGLFATCMTFQK